MAYRPSQPLTWLLACLAAALTALDAAAQGTAADYRRCETMRERVADKVLRGPIDPRWSEDDKSLWYRVRTGPDGFEFVAIDLATGSRTILENAPEQAGPDSGPRRRRRQEPGLRPHSGSARADRSPTARDRLVDLGPDLALDRRDGQPQVRLTSDGGPDAEGWTVSYDRNAWWSPDGRFAVVMRTRAPAEHIVTLVETSPKDQVQPKLHQFGYAKPGDPLPHPSPVLIDIASAKTVPLDATLFAEPFWIQSVRWDADSSRFTFLYNQRGHQVVRLLAVAAATGAVTTLIEESSPTFVDYAHKLFLHWLPDAGKFLWRSERDEYPHLYLCDAATGAIQSQLTKGPWCVRSVMAVDSSARTVTVRAMGIHEEQDPYHVHYARVNLDSGAVTDLTFGDGTHQIVESPDGEYYVDTWSRVDHPPVSELRRTVDGSLVAELERADATPLLATGWQAPERFAAKGRDGKTDIYGVIWKPSNFDTQTRYPVIESIYAGPHDAHVPKEFAVWREPHALTELGFIVVKIDGMGTNWRGKAFHDVCWKNLGDSGFPDRIAWMKAAAATRPWMDLTRVGIYGGSAGGQSALRAVLAHGDAYHAAAADCGCHDNRMDKVWWNELWMGWPIGAHYAEQSNVTQAHALRGKLLLTVGELDRNVDPASTMQVVDALIRADKDFELIVFPGAGHGIGESAYGQRRRRDFFVRSLLGVEPRAR
ncbi:MAG: prolyl oligopeptidase family serine peptidase [Planctomycetota bacterium]